MDIDVAAIVEAFAAERELPSIALGISHRGVLSETHMFGTRVLGQESPPDVDSVYRIASMTKSFTAAAILLLRDEGGLSLDDPVATHLPHFDDERVSIRDLLTMNAGFPTDDPWGDRHEPTPLADFDALVARGVSRIRGARGGFEYSNLGYALLGRVITQVTGRDYLEFMTTEVLRPLGMTSSHFDYRAVPAAVATTGYAPSASGLRAEPPTPPGAFSSMGGLYSTIGDLTLWVGQFLAALQDQESGPFAASSLREQQQPHNFARLVVRQEPEVSASSLSYGFGLMVEEHSQLGRFIQHGGGYPGYGSFMRWHPATGIGIVALSNRTYAPMGLLTERISNALVAATEPPAVVPEQLWPETRVAMDVAENLLRAWDDALADQWFAHNMDLDIARAERRDDAAAANLKLDGVFTRVPGSLESRTPAHARWQVRGAAATLWLEVLLSPDRSPRIQTLTYRSPEV